MTKRFEDIMQPGYTVETAAGDKAFIPESEMVFREQEGLSNEALIALHRASVPPFDPSGYTVSCGHNKQRWGRLVKITRLPGQRVGKVAWVNNIRVDGDDPNTRTCEDCGQVLVGTDSMPAGVED